MNKWTDMGETHCLLYKYNIWIQLVLINLGDLLVCGLARYLYGVSDREDQKKSFCGLGNKG